MKTSKPYTLLNKAEPYLWILPSIILMSIFIIVPIGFVFRMEKTLMLGGIGGRRRRG